MNYLNYFMAFLLFSTVVVSQPTSVVAQNKAQQTVIETKGTKLPDLFKRIERQTNAKIIFSYDDVSSYTFKGSINLTNAESAVKAAITGWPLTYRVDGQYIYIDKTTVAELKSSITISGKVVDKSGEPLPGVTVMVVGTNRGWGTAADGMFYAEGSAGEPIALNFRYIGMKNQILTFDGSKDVTGLRIVMEDEENELADVVVNGMFERKASTFTGSVTTFNQQQ